MMHGNNGGSGHNVEFWDHARINRDLVRKFKLDAAITPVRSGPIPAQTETAGLKIFQSALEKVCGPMTTWGAVKADAGVEADAAVKAENKAEPSSAFLDAFKEVHASLSADVAVKAEAETKGKKEEEGPKILEERKPKSLERMTLERGLPVGEEEKKESERSTVPQKDVRKEYLRPDEIKVQERWGKAIMSGVMAEKALNAVKENRKRLREAALLKEREKGDLGEEEGKERSGEEMEKWQEEADKWQEKLEKWQEESDKRKEESEKRKIEMATRKIEMEEMRKEIDALNLPQKKDQGSGSGSSLGEDADEETDYVLILSDATSLTDGNDEEDDFEGEVAEEDFENVSAVDGTGGDEDGNGN